MGPGQWQAFLWDVQQILEDSYLDAMDAGGSHEINLTTNGFIYYIDIAAMTQTNPKTQRLRKIRRREESQITWLEDREGLLSKIAELEAQVSEMDEANKFHSRKVRTLTNEKQEVDVLLEESQRKNEKLTSEMIALQKQADHSAQLSLQEMWRTQHQGSPPSCSAIGVGDALFRKIQCLLRAAVPTSHHSQCDSMRQMELVSMEQIHNVKVWKNYQHRKNQLQEELKGVKVQSVASKLKDCCSWITLDTGLNEIIALHGTNEEKAKKIEETGFDYRLSREEGLYGQGLYFSDESCKVLQYSGALCNGMPSGVGCIIVARLLLGDPCFTNGPRKGERVEPYKDLANPGQGRFNSVIARAGIVGNAGQQQVHQEFVIYDGAQAYPELLLRFKC